MEKLFMKSYYPYREAEELFGFLCRNAIEGEIAHFLNQDSVALAFQEKERLHIENQLRDLLQSGKIAIVNEILQSKSFIGDKKYFHQCVVDLCVKDNNMKGLQYFLEEPAYVKEGRNIVKDQSIVVALLNELTFNKDILAYLVNQHNIEKNTLFTHMATKYSVFPTLRQEINEVMEAKRIKIENKKLEKNIKKVGAPLVKKIRKI